MNQSSPPAASSSSHHLAVPTAWRRPDVLLATVLVNLLGLALPIVILQVYDRIVPNHSLGTLDVLLSAVFVVAVLDGLLRGARSAALGWTAARYEYLESMRLLEHILHTDLVKFDRSSVSTYLDQIQGLERIRDFHAGQSMLMLVDLPFVFLFLGLIWLFAGSMVLIPVSVMLGFVLLSAITGRKLRQALEEQNTVDRRRQDFVLEVLNGIHTVKALAMEQLMMRRFERLQAQSAEAISEVSRLGSLVQGLGATLSQAVMVGFVAVGSLSVLADQLSVGALAAGTMLAGRVLQPSLKAMNLWTQLQSLGMARRKLEALYDTPLEALHDQTEAVTLKGGILLRDIHFRHEGAEEELLSGIDLEIKPGESIGITGANGSGKSTLVNIMMGFMNPTRGAVYMDGRDIHDLDRSSVRAQIGLMPQKGIILQGTILENMTLFREGEAVDQAIELAKALGLDEQIMQMPDGLDTPIGGTSAASLSEGIRQLIILVRSLVGYPPVVIFDDANAALDIKHDIRLTELLRSFKSHRTMVVVSHRPSLLRTCDRCFDLVDGKLLERENTRPKHERRAMARSLRGITPEHAVSGQRAAEPAAAKAASAQ